MRDETTSTQFGILEKAESCGSSKKLKTNLIYTQNPYKLWEGEVVLKRTVLT